jgi:predicted RNA binding protein YcfA (HicA-like mRNA interferase family)
VKLPRELSGEALASLLRRYGYGISRQTGSHLRLTSTRSGETHHVTIPRHQSLKVGTLSAILANVAAYLGIDRQDLAKELFDR